MFWRGYRWPFFEVKAAKHFARSKTIHLNTLGVLILQHPRVFEWVKNHAKEVIIALLISNMVTRVLIREKIQWKRK